MINERRTAGSRIDQEVNVLVNVNLDGTQESLDFECSAKDFSAQGIRLHGKPLLKLDSQVDLVVHLQEKQRDYRLSGVVKWVTETTENEHLAGVQLSENLQSDINDWKAIF